LPAALRHRWSLDEGGEVGIIDLGGSALLVPGGAAAARRELHRVLRERYEAAVAELTDPELIEPELADS
jgi:bifunctional DNA-binding transcriptional regulator/antitoxin component of YhaV-PrlF toxin-antitoxin module